MMAAKKKKKNAKPALWGEKGGNTISFSSTLFLPPPTLISLSPATRVRDSHHTFTHLLDPQIAPFGLNIAMIACVKEEGPGADIFSRPFLRCGNLFILSMLRESVGRSIKPGQRPCAEQTFAAGRPTLPLCRDCLPDP